MTTSTGSRTELKHRLEARRKEMEARLDELQADADAKTRKVVDSLRQDVRSMGDAVQHGWEDLADKTVEKMNEWLSRSSS